jgi:hypothetical protein
MGYLKMIATNLRIPEWFRPDKNCGTYKEDDKAIKSRMQKPKEKPKAAIPRCTSKKPTTDGANQTLNERMLATL